MRLFMFATSLSAAMLLANPAAAQERSDLRPWVGFDLLTSKVDGEAAENAGTGTRAWGVLLTGGVTVEQVVSVSAEIGGVGLRDAAQFTTPTTGGDKTSSVGAGMGTLSVGLQTPPLQMDAGGPAVSVGVNLGSTWLRVVRGIDQCVDCPSEDLEIRAGSFWEPGLRLNWDHVGITARYRVYGGDSDVQDALLIGFTAPLGRRTPAPKDDAPAEAP
jgi:hypothetical protein